MASPSLIAFLIVCKYADHLRLYRISQILKRMGIEISDALMSDWLLQGSELFDELMKRMIATVLATGHVFTDDTILPMQNNDPNRHTTVKSRLSATAPALLYLLNPFSRGLTHAANLSKLQG